MTVVVNKNCSVTSGVRFLEGKFAIIGERSI